MNVVLGVFGLWLGIQRERDMRAIFPGLDAPAPSMGSHGVGWTGKANGVKAQKSSRNGNILVDTSAIIDGRIADLSITGPSVYGLPWCRMDRQSQWSEGTEIVAKRQHSG